MTTTTAPPSDAQLVAAVERGDEAAIDAAYTALAAGVSPALLLALVKAMLGLGLGRVAEAILTTVGKPLLVEPSVARLAERLGRLPGGEVPSVEQQAWARRNLAALLAAGHATGVAGLDRLQDWMASEDIVILRDRLGRTQAMRREAGGSLRFVLPFRLQVAPAMASRFAACSPPFAAVAGLAPPHVLLDLLLAERNSRHPPRLLLAEVDPLVVAAWLRSGDLVESIASTRLVCRFGQGGLGAYLAELESGSDLPPVQELFVLRPEVAIGLGFGDIKARSHRIWAATSDRLTAEARVRYGDRGPAHWLPRFRAALTGRQSLRIAGIASRHTAVLRHMMRDLLGAFEARGHATTWLAEPTAASSMVDTVGPFAREDFDLAVSFNYLRSHPQPLLPVELPYVCWMQDVIQTAQTREAGESQGPLDLLVVASGGFYESCFGYPVQQSIDAPNLTSWSTYGAIGDEPRAPRGPALLYVGHGWEPPELLIEQLARTRPARVLLEAALAGFRSGLAEGGAIAGFDRMRIEARALEPLGGPPSGQAFTLHWTMQSLYDRLFRHQALEWAARWCETHGQRFVIHGEGWERHPTLGRYAAGPIENGRPLGEACRDAMVVLHANGNASLHQRLLDGAAAGGCVLTRWNPADEMPRHHRTLAAIVGRHGISTMAGLLDFAAKDVATREAVAGLERTLGCAIARDSDPRRAEDRRVIQATAFWPEETLGEDGLFKHMTSDRGLMTPHGAEDIDGFAAASFRSEAELVRQLDAIAGDDALRVSLAAPMRESVRQQFTVEWLAGAILERMTAMLERAAAASAS